MQKRFVAFILAIIVVTAVIWVILSAMFSFVRLDWVAVTALPAGRLTFVIVWLWAVAHPVVTGKIGWKDEA